MISNNRLFFALTASVLLNAGCVAVVGEAALQRRTLHTPRSAAPLHPAALQMAANRSEENGPGDTSGSPGDGSAGTASGSQKPGSDQSTGDEAGPAQANPREYMLDYRLSRADAAAMHTADTLERRRSSGQPLSDTQQKTLARLQQQLTRTAVRAIDRHEALQEHKASQEAARGFNSRQMASSKITSNKVASNNAHSSRMTVVTRPSVPGRNSHPGEPGNSISPKMLKYPKMKLDLGTIHMTRPKHGITAGGSSDMRDVEITAHFVVDDPNNVPKTFQPNHFVKMFASKCNGDPGNTSRCLPTGGNTSLGGTTLHGRHDHITGVKYCLPGSGGLPGGGSPSQQTQMAAQNRQGQDATGKAGQEKEGQEKEGQGKAGQGDNRKDDGPLAGSHQVISQSYPGSGSAPAVRMAGWQAGHMNPNEVVAATINALHLPAGHSDFRGLVPGAEVPQEDQKWVTDPKSHQAAAPPGVQTFPLPHFRISPRSIGSMSKFGTINWGQPVKIHHKKQPLGGDGSGLLGSYYRGNNFDQLVMTRPDRNIDYDWSAGPPDPRIARTAEYSVRWEGKLVPKVTDTYTLMAGADDGVRVYLDDRLVISNWTVHAPSEDTAQVNLVAGHAYKLKVEYFENGYGYAAMKLYWESPRVPREYIPEQCLRYPKTSETP